MNRELPRLSDDADRLHDLRRVALVLILSAVLLGPAVHLLYAPITGTGWFLIAGSLALLALVLWQFRNVDVARVRSTPWSAVLAMMALGIALLVVGGQPWLGGVVVASAFSGLRGRTPRPAMLFAAAGVIATLVSAAVNHFPSGSLISVLAIPLASLFAYSAARRNETMDMLRRTRAELARAAAAEERLRIARDLHDLLGHSLSLITLKAELAGRVVGTDPERAVREIAELESVARQSLSDVREAVAGFRQPDLAGELAAARQLLDAAGISSQITANAGQLPDDVDAALAWAVREGATNVVRHSRASHVDIRVMRSASSAIAEISDNGRAVPEDLDQTAAATRQLTAGPDGRIAQVRARPAFVGSGLAGLAERVRSLGGELAAGSVEPRGFLLRVVVPLAPQA